MPNELKRPHPADPAARIAVVPDALVGRSLAECLAALARQGVFAVEPQVGTGAHLDVANPAATRLARSRMRDGGFTVRGVDATTEHPLGHRDLPRLLELAAELGAGFVRVFPPRYRPSSPAGSQLAAAARAVADLARGADGSVRVLIEPCAGSLAPSPELALRVLQESGDDRAGVVFDPANMLLEGHLQPSFAIGLLGDRLGHVHVKNSRVTVRPGPWDSVSAPLRDGHVSWPEVLDALGRAGYAGWLSIDHLSRGAPDERLRADVGALRQLVRASRLAPGP
jgi:sugar phosphate isomerase/epimerase